MAKNTTLRNLHVTNGRLQDDELKTLSTLPKLAELHLDKNPVSDEGVQHLSATRLKVLSLAETEVTDAGIRHIAEHAELESLDVSSTALTAASIPVLRRMPHLRTLSLRGCKLSDESVSLLWNAPMLSSVDLTDIVGLTDGCLRGVEQCTSLEKLSISGPGFTDEALLILAESPSLKKLYLYSTACTSEGFLRLRKSRPELWFYGQAADDDGRVARFAVAEQRDAVSALEDIGVKVDLDREQRAIQATLFDAASTAQALTRLKELPTITDIFFSGSSVKDADLQLLASLPRLKSVGFLKCPKLTDSGLHRVAELASVTRVSVRDCPLISNAGIAHLSELPRLEMLSLNKLRLSDDVFESIGNMRSLQKLHISDVPISGVGVQHLGELPKLEQLVLRGCPLEESVAEGIAQIPNIKTVALGRTTSDSFAPQDLGALVRKLRKLRDDVEIIR